MFKLNNQKAFTLIELLVVISIIGLLSSVVLASLNTARSKARGASRFSDLRQMRNALELYYSKNGIYPAGSGNECGGWDGSGTDIEDGVGNGQFLQPLITDGIFGSTPRDPQGGNCRYQYIQRKSGAAYQIAIYTENSVPNHPVCSGEGSSLYCIDVNYP